MTKYVTAVLLAAQIANMNKNVLFAWMIIHVNIVLHLMVVNNNAHQNLRKLI